LANILTYPICIYPTDLFPPHLLRPFPLLSFNLLYHTFPFPPPVILSFLALPLGGEVGTPRFTQYFHGSLSGLTIRPGRIETQKVISCLQACKEGLDINSLESLAKDIKVCEIFVRTLIDIIRSTVWPKWLHLSKKSSILWSSQR